MVNAKGILSAKNGMNIYRGCTHGCIYCDSRSLCYQMQHDFEDIEVKQNAPELLEQSLRRKRKKCMIGTGSMCDPFMHCEEKLKLTHKCMEIIDRYGFGFSVMTKSDRILDELELLESINEKAKCVLQMTLTTCDERLSRILEPNVCITKRRYEVLKIMQQKGIPTVVWLSPLLPYINDTEENFKGLLDMCFDAGVRGIVCYGIGLTLRDGNREYFYAQLDRYFPGIKEKYIRRYGNSYECLSDNNETLMKLFHNECEKRGVLHNIEDVFAYIQEFEMRDKWEQLSLF